MSTEKMREDFEAWSANHDYLGGIETDRAISGNYSDVDLHHAWEAWQASRAAIEVELPHAWTGWHKMTGEPLAHGLMNSSEVRQAIESLGLKVKPC